MITCTNLRAQMELSRAISLYSAVIFIVLASWIRFRKIRLAIQNFSAAVNFSLFSHFSTHLSPQKTRYVAFSSWDSAPFCFSPVKQLVDSFPSAQRKIMHFRLLNRQQKLRFSSSALVTLKSDDCMARFSFDERPEANNGNRIKVKERTKRVKKSRRAKLKELRFFRLKAKKKMKSPNPEVRIRYKLEKAKRKEEWLIEKLRKYDIPKGLDPICDPEIMTEEERFYLKRTGEKKKNYVNVGRRGVFGGVVLNMHLHWKKHETVKVVCKPCRPGQVHEYAEELARLSKGIIIDIKPNNTILFYRGKNYVQPEVMSPPGTLSKQKALEKYKFEQSLEHTGRYIEKLELELEEYHKYVASYKTRDNPTSPV
ncbi:unnamed protein product [Spirodela intermedia]|uniref:CRM domain-containing protein n=1 Tax=Spirodela intermedia TaxID=51605 RepID=A0A7I8LCY5_SPIIN|nr:unnamed protein product [Spirodela intermedia]